MYHIRIKEEDEDLVDDEIDWDSDGVLDEKDEFGNSDDEFGEFSDEGSEGEDDIMEIENVSDSSFGVRERGAASLTLGVFPP